jgi:hypothetical protein
MHKARREKRQVALFFADGTKAFDLTTQSTLLEALDEYVGDNPSLCPQLKAAQVNTRLTTYRGAEAGDMWTTAGVPQGSPLGPTSFVLTYELMQLHMDRSLGVQQSLVHEIPIWVPGLEHQKHATVDMHRHMFVDDHLEIVTFDTKRELQRRLQSIMDAKKVYGVRDNAAKSQLLVHATTPNCKKHMGPKRNLILDGAPVKIDYDAKYLGTYISSNGGASKAIEYRV